MLVLKIMKKVHKKYDTKLKRRRSAGKLKLESIPQRSK